MTFRSALTCVSPASNAGLGDGASQAVCHVSIICFSLTRVMFCGGRHDVATRSSCGHTKIPQAWRGRLRSVLQQDSPCLVRGVPLSDFWITSRTDAKDKGVDTRVGCKFLRFRDQSHHIQMGRLGKDASDFPNWGGRQMGLIWEKAPGM